MTTMRDPAWEAGNEVAGRYRLVSRLGEGGMGAVWRATDATLACDVALKVLSPVLVDNADGKRRFLFEAQSAAKLRSPHVVQVMDHGVDGSTPFIVMEMLDGESLAIRLARRGRLSHAETSRIVTHIARAMSKAHEAGIVHRDLKPDNVYLVRNDDEDVAKVLDFGIAKTTDGLVGAPASVPTRSGALLGTPFYMSPEQVRGKDVDSRTDLWSLAVIAFECLCGRLPFESDTVGDLLVVICTAPIPVPSSVADVPPGFDEWFAKATSRDKASRFQSAREMAAALATLDGGAARPSETPSGPIARDETDGTADTIVSPSGDLQSGDVLRRVRSGAVATTGTFSDGAVTKSTSEQARPRRARSAALLVALAATMAIAFFVQRGLAPAPASKPSHSWPPVTESRAPPTSPPPLAVTPIGSGEASAEPAPSAAPAASSAPTSAPSTSAAAGARRPKPPPPAGQRPPSAPTNKEEVLAF